MIALVILQMPIVADQVNNKIEVNEQPSRIISLVPSLTELLFHLQLNDEVIGITKFCIHPQQWFQSKTRIGGTKTVDLEKLHSLQPDLIVANKEENDQQQIEELSKSFPVWVSDISNLQQALEMINSVGEITNRIHQANQIVDSIKNEFSGLSLQDAGIRVCYLIWKDPYMTIGGDTFIHNMLQHAGFENIFQDKKRYPKTSLEELNQLSFEYLFLSSEPFPFKQKHADELQELLPGKKIILVDGEIFSWYGSRLIKAPAYFKQLQLMMFS
jgi:ABC-type Fe3+-hydroxamate transport system substrate-binding protein